MQEVFWKVCALNIKIMKVKKDIFNNATLFQNPRSAIPEIFNNKAGYYSAVSENPQRDLYTIKGGSEWLTSLSVGT